MLWFYVVGSIVVIFGVSVFFGAPYIPSRRQDVRRLFTEPGGVKLSKNDVLLDLGSGDGVVLREAADLGAKAIGYEIHPFFVILSKFLSRKYSNLTIKLANGWTRSFPSDVTLVYIFSVGRDGKRLTRLMERETRRLGRPLRLVCYGNPLPNLAAVKNFEAYSLYEFDPKTLHLTEA